MTDPASAIKREIEITIDQLISTLRQGTPLTAEDFNVYYARLAKVDILSKVLDRRKPQPAPAHRSKFHRQPAA
jgi:hypothetical protein